MIDITKIPIQILCLDKRKELWTELVGEINNELENNNVHPFVCGDGETLPIEEYDHVDTNELPKYWGYAAPGHVKNHYNAKLCHNKIVQKAKDNNWEYFLMLEDDSYITDRFNKVWNGLNPYLEQVDDWDLLYLGWWIGDENDEWNIGLEKDFEEKGEASIMKWNSGMGGLHAVIIRNTMYDKILNLPNNDPVDSHLNRLKDINRYVITPKIIHIKTTWSFCEGSELKRNYL